MISFLKDLWTIISGIIMAFITAIYSNFGIVGVAVVTAPIIFGIWKIVKPK